MNKKIDDRVLTTTMFLKSKINKFNLFRIYKSQKFRMYNKRHNNICGDKVSFGKYSYVENSFFDDYSGCNRNCCITSTWVGRYVNIGPYVMIGQRDHIYQNFTTHDFCYHNREFVRNYEIFIGGGVTLRDMA